MLADLIHVFAYASLPVAIVSFLLIYWSISQGYVGSGDEDSDEVSDKETKQSHEKTHEEFIRKWRKWLRTLMKASCLKSPNRSKKYCFREMADLWRWFLRCCRADHLFNCGMG